MFAVIFVKQTKVQEWIFLSRQNLTHNFKVVLDRDLMTLTI